MIASEQEIEELIAGFADEFVLNLDKGGSLPTTHDIIQTKLLLIGESAVLPLMRALDNDNADIRKWAVSTLGLLDDPRAVEPLLTLLEQKTEDINLLTECVTVLGTLGDKRAVAPLLATLSESYTQRIASFATSDFALKMFYGSIAESLAILGDKRAVEPIIKVVSKGGYNIASSFIATLGQLDDKRAFDVIATILEEKAKAVREIEAKNGGKVSLDNSAFDDDFRLMRSALFALSHLEDERAYDLISPFMRSKDYYTRDTTIAALINLKDVRTYSLFVSIFENERSDKSTFADELMIERMVSALGMLRDSRAFELLVSLLQDFNRRTSNRVALALGELGDPRAFEVLLEELQKGNNPYAAIGLGKLGDKRAVEPLIQAVGDSSNPWRAACAATRLGELGDSQALKPLLKALESESTAVRFRAAEALGKLGQSEALPALEYLALHDFGDNAEIQGGPSRVDEAALTAIRQIRRSMRKAA